MKRHIETSFDILANLAHRESIQLFRQSISYSTQSRNVDPFDIEKRRKLLVQAKERIQLGRAIDKIAKNLATKSTFPD